MLSDRQSVMQAVIPVHWQIFIGHSPKKYRTSDENIGFIGHVSVYQYTSACVVSDIIMNMQTISLLHQITKSVIKWCG